jgi:hypothetical protein
MKLCASISLNIVFSILRAGVGCIGGIRSELRPLPRFSYHSQTELQLVAKIGFPSHTRRRNRMEQGAGRDSLLRLCDEFVLCPCRCSVMGLSSDSVTASWERSPMSWKAAYNRPNCIQVGK